MRTKLKATVAHADHLGLVLNFPMERFRSLDFNNLRRLDLWRLMSDWRSYQLNRLGFGHIVAKRRRRKLVVVSGLGLRLGAKSRLNWLGTRVILGAH